MSQVRSGRRRDILEDSKSVLRQVSGALQDLGVEEPAATTAAVLDRDAGRGLPHIAAMLIQAYVEINSLIEMLRDSRGVLEQAALHRLQKTHQRIQDVTTATESAATDMLDTVDRTMGLLDSLGDRDSGEAGTVDQIREELHTLVMALQFQDIMSQQLGYASSVLVDLETRLERIADIFGTHVDESGIEEALEAHVTCDPNASLGDADARQSLADSIFG